VADGFAEVHGSQGYGSRNGDGEMILGFSESCLTVANTCFVKNEYQNSHMNWVYAKFTHESGLRRCRRAVVRENGRLIKKTA